MNVPRLRDRTAAVAVRLAKRMGIQFDILDPKLGTVTGLWGFLDHVEQKTGLDMLSGVSDYSTYIFVLPRQSSPTFPDPTNEISAGVQVRYPSLTGDLYDVITVEPDNEDVSIASTFKLTCRGFDSSCNL